MMKMLPMMEVVMMMMPMSSDAPPSIHLRPATHRPAHCPGIVSGLDERLAISDADGVGPGGNRDLLQGPQCLKAAVPKRATPTPRNRKRCWARCLKQLEVAALIRGGQGTQREPRVGAAEPPGRPRASWGGRGGGDRGAGGVGGIVGRAGWGGEAAVVATARGRVGALTATAPRSVFSFRVFPFRNHAPLPPPLLSLLLPSRVRARNLRRIAVDAERASRG
ncbi:unnamed protein product [Lampetra fluviatilis]